MQPTPDNKTLYKAEFGQIVPYAILLVYFSSNYISTHLDGNKFIIRKAISSATECHWDTSVRTNLINKYVSSIKL